MVIYSLILLNYYYVLAFRLTCCYTIGLLEQYVYSFPSSLIVKLGINCVITVTK